jgi:hypothetical protein
VNKCNCGECTRCIRAERERIRADGLAFQREELEKERRWRGRATSRRKAPPAPPPAAPPPVVRPWEPEGPWPVPLTDPFMYL